MKNDQQKEKQLKIMSGMGHDGKQMGDQEIFDRLTALQQAEGLFYKVYLFREDMKTRGFRKSKIENGL